MRSGGRRGQAPRVSRSRGAGAQLCKEAASGVPRFKATVHMEANKLHLHIKYKACKSLDNQI